MSLHHDILTRLRRPRLLVRAAGIGLVDYDRSRCLPRLLRLAEPPRHPLPDLAEAEADAEAQRRQGDAAYSPAEHVELLIALIAEALAAARAEPG